MDYVSTASMNATEGIMFQSLICCKLSSPGTGEVRESRLNNLSLETSTLLQQLTECTGVQAWLHSVQYLIEQRPTVAMCFWKYLFHNLRDWENGKGCTRENYIKSTTYKQFQQLISNFKNRECRKQKIKLFHHILFCAYMFSFSVPPLHSPTRHIKTERGEMFRPV